MKLIIDLMGADLGPEEVLNGVCDSIEETKLNFILVGPEKVAKKVINERNIDSKRIEYIDTDEYITNEDDPARSLRRKKDSSIVLALNKLNEIENGGLLSAGSTGALLAGGIFITKRLENVERATLASFVPNAKGGETILVDSGAVVDATPEMLNQFAVMGSVVAEKYLLKTNPKVSLINVGVEEGKGDKLSKETFNLLKENSKINFIGNIEARDFLSGKSDVIVADGFAGNMLIKSTEGAAGILFREIKDEITKNFKNKLGALLLKSVFKKVKNKYDYKKVGAAVLIGVKKPLFKAHGSSDRIAIKNAIFKAEQFLDRNINKYIEEKLND